MQKLPESTTTSVSEEYIKGVGMLENRLVMLLDVEKVITKDESVELSSITQAVDIAVKSPVTAQPVEA